LRGGGRWGSATSAVSLNTVKLRRDMGDGGEDGVGCTPKVGDCVGRVGSGG
jgi:hypothetical protein